MGRPHRRSCSHRSVWVSGAGDELGAYGLVEVLTKCLLGANASNASLDVLCFKLTKAKN